MHKARKDIGEALSQVNMVIELIDARIPFSSENPMLAELLGAKPCIKVMNKSDLADEQMLSNWKTYFRSNLDISVASVIATQPRSVRKLIGTLASIQKQREKRPGSSTLLTIMVVGIPNVGKSALINALAGKAIAKTGNEPAVTRQLQTISHTNLALLDTPGVLWPNVENRNSGFRLAATGAIRDTAMSHVDVALFLAEYLLDVYPNYIAKRFCFDTLPSDGYGVLNAVGYNRGCLKSGGLIDIERAAKLLVSEFRHGTIGKICLETPAVMEQERIECETIRQQKASDQLLRQKKRATSSRP